jgi:hypothetical protein
MSLTEAVQAVTALVGALVALLTATVTLIQLRASTRASTRAAGSRRRRVAAWSFAWLARPGPMLAGMAILAAVSGLLLVQLGRDRSDSQTTAVRLLRHLVSEETRRCEQVDPAPPASAALVCALPPPMSRLRISLFASVGELKRALGDRIATAGVAEGDCSTQRFAWDDWSRGRVICDYGGDGVRAELQWSRYDSKVLLEAEAREGADEYDVYEWWRNEGNGAPSNNRLPYPDRFEKYLLERSGIDADACERAHMYKDSHGAVSCEHAPADELYLYYYTDAKALRDTLHSEPGPGACTQAVSSPGRAGYRLSDGTAGVRQCWRDRDDDRSVVEWTSRSSSIYAYAFKDGGPTELDRLYLWWERKGRYLTD